MTFGVVRWVILTILEGKRGLILEVKLGMKMGIFGVDIGIFNKDIGIFNALS